MLLLSDFRFGKVLVRSRQRQVWIDGHRLPLGDRAFDLLCALIANRGRVVDKAELIDIVWPGQDRVEGNLHVHVSALRRHLGAGTIATVHGRGYRFMAAAETSGPVLGCAVGEVTTMQVKPARPSEEQHPLVRFFGRQAELRSGIAMLRPGDCVTLTGPGGVGKTRLVRELATLWIDMQRGPAVRSFWVDLSALTDARLLGAAVATALGFPAPSPRAPGRGDGDSEVLDLLGVQASRRQGLLILDNAEHLLDGVCAIVSAICRHPGDLCLAVTSRHALGLPCERQLAVSGLPVPDSPTERGAFQSPSVCLFSERARHHEPAFAVTESNLADVLKVCRQLDGSPLALGLAAARIPLLGLSGVVSALDERLRAFVDGSPRVRRSHLSLQAVLDWSEKLLEDNERRLLFALSVLQGSFTLAEAAAIAGFTQSWHFVESFDGLLRKSLVEIENEVPGGWGAGAGASLDRVHDRRRWRLLQTTRLYAWSRLQASGDMAATMLRHAAAFAAWAEELNTRWLRGQSTEAQIDCDCLLAIDDCCAAIAWACGPTASDDPVRLGLAIRLFSACARPLLLLGRRHQAIVWADHLWRCWSACNVASGGADDVEPAQWTGALAARMHSAWAMLPATALQTSTDRVRFGQQAMATFEQLGDQAALFDAALDAAHQAGRAQDSTLALDMLDRARHAMPAGAPTRSRARMLEMQQRLHLLLAIGTPPDPQAVDEVLADLDSAGDADSRVAFQLRIEQADIWLLQGRHHAARRALQTLCDEVHREQRWAWRAMLAPFDTLSVAQLMCGDTESAAANLRLALDSARLVDLWGEIAAALACYLAICGRLRAAMQLAGAAEAHLTTLGRRPDALQGLALRTAADVARRSCRLRDIMRWRAEGAGCGPGGVRSMLSGADERYLP